MQATPLRWCGTLVRYANSADILGVQELTLNNPGIVNSKKNTELKYLAQRRI
jgi:hypothetical protein